MDWEVEVSDEFLAWYQSLDESEWESVNGAVAKLEHYGPTLGRPYVDTLIGSKYPNMKELRVQHQGRPLPHPVRLRPSPERLPRPGW